MRGVDAFGNVVVPDGLYFIQDTRTCVGNCALWWAKDRAGYCCDLNDAGVYMGKDLPSRSTDIAWPVDFVRAHTVTHVRVETLNAARFP